METLGLSYSSEAVRIEVIPDGIKVVSLSGHVAKRLADLSLHQSDLEFAKAALDAINQAPMKPTVCREALWRSAIIHFVKCFGDGARFRLHPRRIYKDEPTEAMLAFEYFKELRNRHLVHDENSYAQGLPGAVLNDGTKSYKVEKIVCFSAFGQTLEQSNYSNLELLVRLALKWVVAQFDLLCVRVTSELEQLPYDELLALEPLKYKMPLVDELSVKRTTP